MNREILDKGSFINAHPLFFYGLSCAATYNLSEGLQFME